MMVTDRQGAHDVIGVFWKDGADYEKECPMLGSIAGMKIYRQDLRIMLCHILEAHENKSVLELKKKDFRAINLWMSEGLGGTSEDSHGRSSARVNRMHSAMNSLMTYVCDNEEDYGIEVNQSKRVPGLPKERVKDNEDDFFLTY